MTKHFTALMIGLLALSSMTLTTLVGCGGTTGDTLPKPTYRLINASPDTTGLDLLSDDDLLATGIAFGQISAPISRTVESTDLNLRPTGSSVPAWTEAHTPALNNDFIVVGFGRQNFGAESQKRLQLSIQSINRRRPNADRARLYFVHAFIRGTGFETPNVSVQNPGDNPTHEIADIAPGGFREYDIDSGPQTFQVRRNGTDQVYVEKNLNFARGKVYIVLLSGVEGAAGMVAPDIRLLEIPVKD